MDPPILLDETGIPPPRPLLDETVCLYPMDEAGVSLPRLMKQGTPTLALLDGQVDELRLSNCM